MPYLPVSWEYMLRPEWRYIWTCVDVVDRARKIKCDEQRPQCKKCTSTGRKCEGFELSLDPLRPNSTRQLLPSDGKLHSVIAAIQPSATSPDICMTDHEKSAYHYFLSTGAKALWEVSPSNAWIEYALKFSRIEPAVFHAVTAFSVVQRSIQLTLHRTLEPPAARRDLDLATQQFGKASAQLRRYIDSAVSSKAIPEPVLLCCILFLCFDILRGKPVNALTHLDFGRRIIEDINTQHGANTGELAGMSAALLPLAPEIKQIFAYAFRILDKTAVIPSQRIFLTPDPLAPVNAVHRRVPERIGSAPEAKAHLNALLEATTEFRSALTRLAEERLTAEDKRDLHPAVLFCITQCLSRADIPKSELSLRNRLQDLIREHDRTGEALSALANEVKTETSWQQVSLLRLQLFMSSMTLKHCTSPRESSWDAHELEFSKTLNLVERLLHSIATHMPPDTPQFLGPPRPGVERQVSFSLEPSILPATGLIGTKCRDSRLRKRAIALLLSAHRRESLLLSESMGRFHSSLISLEEERGRALNEMTARGCNSMEALTAQDIPEEARILETTLHGETDHSTRVVLGRFAHERDGELEIVQYIHDLGERARWPVEEPRRNSLTAFEAIERRFTGYRLEYKVEELRLPIAVGDRSS